MLQSIDLLDRIERFELDDPTASLPFSVRLARETGWTPAYTQRAIKEYKRFIYLTTIASHPVTPSVAVDEVWHFHLTYTRSYWDQLCGEVLGKPLHHDATRGGSAESKKFRELYRQTLALYEQTFGSTPPPDIWPSVAERFAPPTKTLDVSATHWIIPKPARRTVQRIAALMLLFAVTWLTWDYLEWEILKDILDMLISWVFQAIAFIVSIPQRIANVVLLVMLLILGVKVIGWVLLCVIGVPIMIFEKVTGRTVFSEREPSAYVGEVYHHRLVIAEHDGGDDDGDSGCGGCGGCGCGD